MSPLFKPNQLLGHESRLNSTLAHIKRIPVPQLNSQLRIFIAYFERFRIVCPFYDLLIKPFNLKRNLNNSGWTLEEIAAFESLKTQVCLHLIQWYYFPNTPSVPPA